MPVPFNIPVHDHAGQGAGEAGLQMLVEVLPGGERVLPHTKVKKKNPIFFLSVPVTPESNLFQCCESGRNIFTEPKAFYLVRSKKISDKDYRYFQGF